MRVLLILFCLLSTAVYAGERVLLQSTTSTQNSGLYGYLLPLFTAETGIGVDVVAVGTGQALRNAQNGDADMLIVHAKDLEEAFVAKGYGVARFDLMYNDFILIGPSNDPAGVKSSTSVAQALGKIAQSQAIFISRGDESGTHIKEKALWALGGITPKGEWYKESGSGMGATLRVAIELNGYTLTDRSTWLAFNAKYDHGIAFQGDPPLFNQYGVIAVNPARHPHINAQGAATLIDWLLSETGQNAIAAYTLEGEQLFFPNADKHRP